MIELISYAFVLVAGLVILAMPSIIGELFGAWVRGDLRSRDNVTTEDQD